MSSETLQVGKHHIVVMRSARRRTLSLEIAQGHALLRVPQHLPLRVCKDFISSKLAWLNRHAAKLAAPPSNITFSDGLRINTLGQSATLVHQKTRQGPASRDDNLIKVPLARCQSPEKAAFRKLVTLFKSELARYISTVCQEKAVAMGVSTAELRIRDYRRRWGSCDQQGNLSFNWRLIFAPRPVIDYVVIHELAHRIEFNHSARFWAVVEEFCPQSEDAKRWLRDHGSSVYRYQAESSER